MSRVIKIGNAQGFWGDDVDAAARLLRGQPDLDYLTLDYLAEVSLSIMALQRDRDPTSGFARDFLSVLDSLAPMWKSGHRVRVVTNAGGLDPVACAEACRARLRDAGLDRLRVGLVTGDDVLDELRRTPGDAKFNNLDTGAAAVHVANRFTTANAYVGAEPIAEALRMGADVVVTGRVADPSLTVAPCLVEFGWKGNDWDKIASATVAGHLLECGTQACGGISTDWLDLPDPVDIGFPVVEINDQGEIIVTKPSGTGGKVSEFSVKEQLLYELGDPDNYLSPDVSVSFLSLKVEEVANDRVRVTGARGRPPTDSYKVSATYRDGYKASGTLTIFGRHAVAKARRAGPIVFERLKRAGVVLERSLVECVGAGACVPGVIEPQGAKDEREALEIVLRLSAADPRKEAVERFAREIAPLVCSGPQGTTGYAAGRPSAQPVFVYWPCLIDKRRLKPSAAILP